MMLPLTPERIQAALLRATQELLDARAPAGYWTGELSSSALSTATAVCALAIAQRQQQHSKFISQIAHGLAWLTQHQNTDGGWGDTTLSLSNLSTTVLVWAAFGAVPVSEQNYHATLERAEAWITQHAGSLERTQLAQAIVRRYGKDRTFSVPILTMCALAGRLGPGAAAWAQVIPLPFELAACPPSWFAALRLPVVSYALPALIAIGQAHHYHAPSRNPVARLVRNLTRQRTSRVLESIQPNNGGFLEATPLTSFVTMSLAGSDQVNHPVCKKGLEFLLASQRTDGSWPIDTNLATWLTTLSVNALAAIPRGSKAASLAQTVLDNQSSKILEWLLAQQYRREHPYTHAAPGGWAWTDLPGGVPDADDTAGALLALRALAPKDARTREAAVAGVTWLLNLQNRDGGIPTFCRGWGTLPFDRSSPDLTAHALRAWGAWLEALPSAIQKRTMLAMQRAVRFLCGAQRPDGSWVPLWFGNQHAPHEENPTYGTACVLGALADPNIHQACVPQSQQALSKGLEWLLTAQNMDGSWSGYAKGPASIEETALAVRTLAIVLARQDTAARSAAEHAVRTGAAWLLDKVESGEWMQPAPIGFYFAKLWYYEKLYPLIYTVGALGNVSAI